MGVTGSVDIASPKSRSEERELRIVLEVERAGPCCMDDVAGNIVDVDVRLDAETCNVDAVVRDSEDDVKTMFFSDQLCSYCPGKIFSKYDCLPRYRKIEEGSFVMETFASDTDTVASIVEEVRSISDNVQVKSIVPTDDEDGTELDLVDLTSLTKKQRHALHYAREMGYYDSKDSISLEELAGRMDISTSALSQLLNRAESNVLRQLSTKCD